MLKFTKCDKYCEFSTITVFCFDCPALMCHKCKDLMHKSFENKEHKFLFFDNINLNWNRKEVISSLFMDDDDVDVENIFTEVSRTFSEEIIDGNSWNCTYCSLINFGKSVKCKACYRVQIVRTDTLFEYTEKVNHVTKELCPIFSIFKSMQRFPIENVLYRYLHHKNMKELSILDWFKNVYLKGRNISIIVDIISKLGHHVDEHELMEEYNQYIHIKNKQLFYLYPKKIKFNLNSETLFKCNEINDSNFLPNEFNKKDLTDEDIWKIINKSSKYTKQDERMLMTELDIYNNDKIELLRNFINDDEMGKYLKESFSDQRVQLIHIRQALLDYFLIEDALKFLKKECELCFSEFPMPEIIILITCNHQICKTCANCWLQEVIRNKFPRQWFCTLCSESENEQIDTNQYYFHLREILAGDKVLLNILEHKLFNQESTTNANFHWCPNDKCGFGFEVDMQGIVKIQCNACKTFLCSKCNRMWKEQHENKTCNEYELWMLKEDPCFLNMIGIECPKCRMRYSLAAGGCLHFTCAVCGVEFCGGCSELFVKSCGNSQCSMTGIHSHHPRNCLYHLRDYDTGILETMLQNQEYPHLADKINKSCEVIISDKDFKESQCNEIVHLTTGLCLKHYKEYLVEFINYFKIDPVEFSDPVEINQMLFQLLFPKLEKENGEDDCQYKIRLTKEVKEKCKFYIPSSIKEKKVTNF